MSLKSLFFYEKALKIIKYPLLHPNSHKNCTRATVGSHGVLYIVKKALFWTIYSTREQDLHKTCLINDVLLGVEDELQQF